MNSSLFRVLLLVITLAATGCVFNSDLPLISDAERDQLLRDELFAGSSLDIELAPDDFLALPEEYRDELDRVVVPVEDEAERYRQLRRWMYRRFEEFDFDISETYSIADLSTNRKINCLSFSTMFVAAARYANINANFQLVSAPPYWDASNSTWINNQHINVTGLITVDSSQDLLPGEITDISGYRGEFPVVFHHFDFADDPEQIQYRYTMDISPAVVSSQARRELLDEKQVLSLYYSNKAIQHLLDDDLALTYAYTREALRTDASSVVAWNNLGVVYSRLDQIELAASAFEKAILLDGDAHSAQSNLASAYRRLGRAEDAIVLEESVAAYVAQNPYYHQRLADVAMDAGDYQQAVAKLQDAVELKHNEFLFYHELAIAHQQLGNSELVMENLVNARRHARGEDRARFSGKLQALRELARN